MPVAVHDHRDRARLEEHAYVAIEPAVVLEEPLLLQRDVGRDQREDFGEAHQAFASSKAVKLAKESNASGVTDSPSSTPNSFSISTIKLIRSTEPRFRLSFGSMAERSASLIRPTAARSRSSFGEAGVVMVRKPIVQEPRGVEKRSRRKHGNREVLRDHDRGLLLQDDAV